MFTEIKTQEEFDAAIKDRLERQEKKIGEQYAERLKELESSKASYEDLQKKYTALEESSKGYAGQIEELTGKLKTTEEQLNTTALNSLKQKVAVEKGLPVSMVDRLVGSTEEELSSDADKLIKAFGVSHSGISIKKSTEEEPKDAKREALRDVLHTLQGSN